MEPMSYTKSRRTPDQQLALEKKFGVTLLAGLFATFCMLLTRASAAFGWGD